MFYNKINCKYQLSTKEYTYLYSDLYKKIFDMNYSPLIYLNEVGQVIEDDKSNSKLDDVKGRYLAYLNYAFPNLHHLQKLINLKDFKKNKPLNQIVNNYWYKSEAMAKHFPRLEITYQGKHYGNKIIPKRLVLPVGITDASLVPISHFNNAIKTVNDVISYKLVDKVELFPNQVKGDISLTPLNLDFNSYQKDHSSRWQKSKIIFDRRIKRFIFTTLINYYRSMAAYATILKQGQIKK